MTHRTSILALSIAGALTLTGCAGGGSAGVPSAAELDTLTQQLHKRGVVVAMSGGIDSSVCAALAGARVTSVDLSLMTAKGEAYFFEDVAYSCHRLDINPFQRDHLLVVPFGASDNTEVDTGLDLPANLLIKDALMKVTTACHRNH